MKFLLENWQKVLTEMAAKTIEELPENWFIKINFLSSVHGIPGISIELVEKDSEGNFQRIHGKEDPWSAVTIYKAKPSSGECLGAYIVEGATAPAGFGPLLYDIAMEMAGDSGLTPDRDIVSHDAYKIWDYYLNNRPDIETAQLDNTADPQTPPIEDDCGMLAAEYSQYDDEWQNSPLSKVYYKRNTEKLDNLRALGKVIEDSEVKSPEKPQFVDLEPEPEPFSPETFDWAELDEIYENLKKKDTKNVSKVLVFNKNNEILLLRRIDKQQNWDLPGGHIHKDESFITGAKRETKEETDLDISDLKHIKTDKKDRIIKYFKANSPNGRVSLDPEEHIDYKWVKIEDLDKYSIIKKMKSVIRSQMKTILQEIEPFQRKVRRKHRKMKIRLIGKGKNRYNVGKKMKKPPYKRAKSAPPGAGGA